MVGDSAEGGLPRIQSEVRGSYGQTYDQSISVTEDGRGGLTVVGHCSCPVGYNCKHVVAALLRWSAAVVDPYRPSPEIEAWLRKVKTVAARHAPRDLAAAKGEIAYVVTMDPEQSTLVVSPLVFKRDRRGERIEPPKLVDVAQAAGPTAPRYVQAIDQEILARLTFAGGYGPSAWYTLSKARGAEALSRLAETGRCHIGRVSGALLRAGEARTATPHWTVDSGDRQRFTLVVDGAEPASVLTLTPPFYFDAGRGVVGPLVVDMPPLLLEAMMEAPLVPPGLAEAVSAALAGATGRLPSVVPSPRVIAGYETVRGPPRPIARLVIAEVDRIKSDPSRYGGWRQPTVKVRAPVMSLEFDYGLARFGHRDPKPYAVATREDRPVKIARDFPSEAKMVARLAVFGLRNLETFRAFATGAPPTGWLAIDPDAAVDSFALFLAVGVPALASEGWEIDDSEFPYRLATVDEDGWDVALRPADDGGADWFDLQLGARIDGERMDVTPALIDLLNRLPANGRNEALQAHLQARAATGRVEVRLDDGRLVLLPLSRVAPILEGLLALWGDEPEGSGRVSVFDAPALDELRGTLGAGIAWSGGERLEGLARELRGWTTRAPTPLATGFAATLRPYQQTGLDWLAMLGRSGFGGLLADDMGLGKTVQALAHLCVEKAAGRLTTPALIVAPTSVLPNWIAEAGRFAPELKALVSRGPDRDQRFGDISDHDLIVTSYPLLVRDREVLEAIDWSLVFLDEGQTIRNPATAAAKAAFALKARQRVILSGTPVENHLGDVWSLTHFLNPGLLGDYKSFTRRFRTPIEKRGDREVEARLRARVRPFILRRTKAEVAADLPAKTEIAERVDLNTQQIDLYESTRLIMVERVREMLARKGLARSSIVVLDALLKLRQVCCDPRLVKGASAKARAGGSAKLDRLFELLDQLRSEGRKALLFSQFTSMLTLIAETLDADKRRYAWLTGDTVDRAEPVRRFQSGEVDLFLISLKAGGAGLNLTEADTVILYDPWWNPAVEAQAIDRAHRIGQSKPVFVHRLIAAGTVEEKMLALQSRKRALAEGLWSEDPAALAALTEQDIVALFGPLHDGSEGARANRRIDAPAPRA